jgi:glycosyltransferase involved in cell wall biosynthesis
MRTKPAIAMLGAFPPPLGGASKINLAMYEALISQGVSVERINISGATLGHVRGAAYHVSRFKANWRAAWLLIRSPAPLLYAVPDGGLGVWYSLSLLLIAKYRFARLIVHHHTFQYVDRKSIAMDLIVRLTRNTATHVFLSKGMADRFQAKYGLVKWLVSGNAVHSPALCDTSLARSNGEQIRLGYLSNLCAEKGFFEVAETFETLRALNANVTLDVAGPALEESVKAKLNDLRMRYGDRIAIWGEIRGAAKDRFYAGLDLFLFPTNFKQEASPNVLFEAFAAGVTVLSKRRGCIPETVTSERGKVCPLESDFPSWAAREIRGMSFDEDSRASRRCALRSSILALQLEAKAQFSELVALIARDER